jgi:tetratricopeptide (TPR) repeat protein
VADTRIDELRRRLERDPGSRLFAQLAEELRKEGDLGEAIGVARAGLAVHPAYPSARLTLGRALLDSGDAAGARVELEGALRDAPDNIQASRYLAQAREQLGDLAGAAEQYRKTLLMAPGDRQLQAALAAVEARLSSSEAGSQGPETTPPAPRRAPPPPPVAPAETRSALAQPAKPTPPAESSPRRADPPPVVFAPSRPLAPAPPESDSDEATPGGGLPPTLRIHAAQAGTAPPAPPPPPRAAPPPPAPPAAPATAAPAAPSDRMATDSVQVAAEPADGRPATEAEAGVGGAATPFSSSTLAELYFQQGLVDRAADVYRQLIEQEPENQKARERLAELERSEPAAADPAAVERMARRRALESTIAGLEALLAAVRSR